MRGRSSRQAAWLGAAAGGLTLGVSLLLRAWASVPSLGESIGNGLALMLPGSVFGSLIDALQERGRPLLLLGTSILIILVGTALGYLMARWTVPGQARQPAAMGGHSGSALVRWLAPGLVLLLLTLPLIAAGEASLEWTYVAASAGEWLLLSALVELLLGLLQPQGVQPGRRDGVPQTVSRRRFLTWAGSAAGAVSLGYLGQQVLVAAAPPLPKLHLGRLLDGPQGAAANGLTATRDFYVVSKNLFGPPSVDSASWRLTVEGLKPYSIGYSELRQLLHVRRIQTLECISNPVGGTLISTGIWRGVRLSSLLRRAGVPAGTAQVQFDCADGYTESLPLAQALAPTTLVADELNGTPLTAPHGFPARVLAVDHYGMKNPKWLLAIRPTAHSYLGYWEQQGWEAGAYPKIVSRFDFPSGNSSLGAHRGYLLSGIAFAGTRGISKVELSVDGSRKWLRAELRPVLSPYSWTIWTYPWRPTPGYYTLSVRAVDGLGNVQQPGAGQTYPSGANGYQALTIVVR